LDNVCDSIAGQGVWANSGFLAVRCRYSDGVRVRLNIFSAIRQFTAIASALCAFSWLVVFSGPAHAVNVDGLYDVVVLPTQKPGDSSFAEAMRQVAVRVTGSRDAAVRVMTGKPDALRYTQRINLHPPGYPDGSVQVEFGSTLFDRMLTGAGLPIWGRERPATAIWLALPDGAGRLAWQSATDRAAEREAIQRVALARGLPLVWPTMDAADLATAAGLGSGTRSYAQLMSSGERYRADAVLLGVGSRDASGGVTVRWSFAFNDEMSELQASLDDGIHHAADRCASILAIAPGARASVAVRVQGVRDLDAYARALNYLEGVTLVVAGGVAVEQLGGDELDLRLTVRGDANALRRTIGLGRRLIEVKSDDPGSGDRLVFRLAQ
jgi:hypothetical protein